MDTVKVALVGFGTIGIGVAKILLGQQERIAGAVGRNVKLVRICDKDTQRDRGVKLPAEMLTDDLNVILNDSEIFTAIELVGGIEPARSIILSLLKSGKNVVTANKALLATHGGEIFDAARSYNRSISFEAAVGGGIPVVNAISTALQANALCQLQAIVNGTCNFILTQMEERGTDYATAVAEAQRLGYAEANPAMDVNGTDTVQKLAILAHLGFGAKPNWQDVPRTGIDTVEAIDIVYAKRLGYRIKLLAVAEATPDGVELYVSPTLVRIDTPVANVRDSFNIIRIVGDAVGDVLLQGRGAGELPTASAIVGDVIDTILGRAKITFDTLNLWKKERPATKIKNPAEICGKNYLRFLVEDRPGVLAEIAGILGRHKISIASVLQQQDNESNNSPAVLIIMTHVSREGDTLAAIDTIDSLVCVRGKTVRMRVE
ncbi:MAG: homoserine dehydrogenase [Planctomycetaceae bacterium]|jgi:homoserine dehydrogenase|nr:homoserine dehydrogenase [Planctomycetaceae bacterium]